MTLFKTERLIVKTLEEKDQELFFELFSDPQILSQVPQGEIPRTKLKERFNNNLDENVNILSRKKFDCGIFIKGALEMIGLCLFLSNNENDRELGYRFRVNYWGKGYGTEITEALISYHFDVLKVNKLTADVDIKNIASVRILNKFMHPVCEFYNERDKCTDRRYVVWQKPFNGSNHKT